MATKAKRVIYVSSIDEIDFENVGLHFTTNMSYRHTGGGSNGLTKKGNFEVEFIVSDFEIHDECTEISNDSYPKEKEVVLYPNQDFLATVKIYCTKTRKTIIKRKFPINVGTRCDIWAKNLIF